MARPNTLRLNFSGVSQRTVDKPARLKFSGINILTQKSANLKFWGASAQPVEDAVIFYQVNSN